MRKYLLVLAFSIASLAKGVGGACPTASTYLDINGNSTTLAALGVTNCYYVAANGSNSNTGVDESHPWLVAPGMLSQTGNPLSVWNSNLPAGTGIILRGGDTWHMGNSGLSPYAGGGWRIDASPGPAGTSSHPIYFGVDKSWFTGGSWARPILTWDNPPSTSQSLTSCNFPSSDTVNISGSAWMIVDNFEITGSCTTSANWNIVHMNYGSMSGPALLFNLYIHGWSHVAFSPNPNNCTALGTCMSAFRGSTNSGNLPPGDTLLYDVVDGFDSDPVPMEFCFCGGYHVGWSYFNRGSQFITRTQHVIHDTTITNFFDNGHANVLESNGDYAGAGNAEATYNNVFSHLYVTSTVISNVCLWPQPPVGSTHYWFNNIAYDIGPCQMFNLGQNGTNQGTIALFNMTFQNRNRTDGGFNNISCSASGNSDPYTNANIFFMSDNTTSLYASNCAGRGTDQTQIVKTNAQANSAGYTAAQPIPYSPTSSSSFTVNAGTNKQTFCSALSTAASSDTSLSNAANACLSDSTFACNYNSSSHTVSCPARTVITRPLTLAWDVGYTSLAPVPSGPAVTITGADLNGVVIQ